MVTIARAVLALPVLVALTGGGAAAQFDAGRYACMSHDGLAGFLRDDDRVPDAGFWGCTRSTEVYPVTIVARIGAMTVFEVSGDPNHVHWWTLWVTLAPGEPQPREADQATVSRELYGMSYQQKLRQRIEGACAADPHAC